MHRRSVRNPGSSRIRYSHKGHIHHELTGCGTMGIAVLSGVLSSLDSSSSGPIPKWEAHTSGTVTPVAFVEEDPALPSRFLACVSREVSARQLRPAFTEISRLGAAVEIHVANNVQAVKQSDVILLWYVSLKFSLNTYRLTFPLSCKPQLAHAILSEAGMQEALEKKLLISILAGVTISQLTQMVGPTTKVVRAMPNTPCKVSSQPSTLTTNDLTRGIEDSRRNDHRVHARRESTPESIHHPQYLLLNRALQIP